MTTTMMTTSPINTTARAAITRSQMGEADMGDPLKMPASVAERVCLVADAGRSCRAKATTAESEMQRIAGHHEESSTLQPSS
jgi:hypothetical protein